MENGARTLTIRQAEGLVKKFDRPIKSVSFIASF
jgi:hypothetical protein